MDYNALAAEFLKNMGSVRKAKVQKNIHEALQGEGVVLHYIASHGDEVQPGEISQKMNVSTARIATTLNSLEKKGLITRQIDTSNRRQILVRITQKGKDFAETHRKTILGVAANMLELLGEQDAKEYVRITKRLAEILPTCEETM